MVMTLLNQINLEGTREKLERASDEEHIAAFQELSASLAKNIRAGTITLDEIDAFIRKFPDIQPDLKEYLLDKKADLLFKQGHHEEALKYCDVALGIKSNPATWTWKGNALLQMNRIDEAIQAFQKAYSLRDNFGPQKQEYLKDLFRVWGAVTFFLGLDAVLEQDPRELQQRVEEFVEILEKAKQEGQEQAMGKLVFREPVTGEPSEVTVMGNAWIIPAQETEQLKEALEELEVAVRLTSIKDPFERFRELSKEISKVWPEGVSAVDAIREQRDREWNQ